jgi:membrane protein
VLWLVGSGLFSLYAARFGNFNKTYGSMAAVAVTLLWFQLTSFVVLLGALLDAEMEHQTARDTTTGPERPMGQRGASMADTLGQGGDGEPPSKGPRS